LIEKTELKALVSRLVGFDVRTVADVLNFVKNNENLKQFEGRDQVFLSDLHEYCMKMAEKFERKYKNSFSFFLLKKRLFYLIFSRKNSGNSL